MEYTRPIRALTRGLDALTVLNIRGSATVSEIAQEIKLPRTTVYRILETLRGAGFASRDDTGDRYRLTVLVRRLSVGFEDDAWISHGARPLIVELSREIVWPISVATLSGTVMMIRESTDHNTPLALERLGAGIRMPLLTSAMGRAFLAFCPAPRRDALLDELARSNKEEDKLAQGPRSDLLRRLSDIKVQGYATATRARRLLEEVSLSVPVNLADRVLAVLTVRFAASTVPLPAAVERLLPRLRRGAAKLSGTYSANEGGTRAAGAPQATVS